MAMQLPRKSPSWAIERGKLKKEKQATVAICVLLGYCAQKHLLHTTPPPFPHAHAHIHTI